MKKHMQVISSLIVIFSVVIGFAGVMYKDTRAYQELAEQHLENILSLSNTDISNHITDSITKPVMVSKTMANDEFLKNWLLAEPQSANDGAYLEQLYRYLKAYQEKYGYTTVFCVSNETLNYYYQDGLNKTITPGDAHDIWYYNFTESDHEYDLEVDTNEAQDNSLTIFVNFRVEADGRLLGVIGVGLQVYVVEDTIRSYEENYGMSAYIINAGGAKNSFSGSTDVFIEADELAARTGIEEEIELLCSSEPKMQWFTAEGERKCLITQYNDTLGWYLILEKDTDSITRVFTERVQNNVVFMLLSLFACILVTTTVFIYCNRRIVEIENTDDLTGLPNRKLFATLFATFVRRHREQKMTLFMFDIDRFKRINDTCGHMFGNAILTQVGLELRTAIEGCGIAARWGGDEFLGVLACGTQEAERILARYMEGLSSEEKEECYRMTVSVGLTEVKAGLNLEQMVNTVDEALYRSKAEGRNRISVI